MVCLDDTPLVSAKDDIAVIRNKDVSRKDIKIANNLLTTMSEKVDTYTKIVHTGERGTITVTANTFRTGKKVWLLTVWGHGHKGPSNNLLEMTTLIGLDERVQKVWTKAIIA